MGKKGDWNGGGGVEMGSYRGGGGGNTEVEEVDELETSKWSIGIK